MLSLNPLKQQAIEMRKLGKTYSEIRSIVPVAKSTLTLWLREVGLAKRQKQAITAKRIAGQKKGAAAQRLKRLVSSAKIFEESEKEIGSISEREFFLIGAALYWAEGSKQKDHSVSVPVQFTNSDPKMIVLFMEWAKRQFEIGLSDFRISLTIHDSHIYRIEEVRKFWETTLDMKPGSLSKIYYKHAKLSTNRKNTGSLYYGVLKVTMKASIDHNRRIAGWVRGICKSKVA